MDLRMLESLKRAIPIVLRHLDSYVELVEQDLSAAKSVAASRVKALMLLSVSAVFAVLFACLLIVALTWDSQYRVLTIGIMAGVFALVAVASGTYFAKKRAEPFASLKREWREDRALVKSILARDSHEESFL
jgi:uncharacterized membrane protein YqjE